MTYLVICIFAGWFVLIVLNHFKGLRFMRAIEKRDYLDLIPNWGFFTMNMSKTDVFLLTRDRLADGTETPWRPIATGKRNGKIRPVYPQRRIRAAVSRTRHILRRTLAQEGGSSASIKRMHAYLLLLRYVLIQERNPDAKACQFLIATTADADSELPIQPRLVSSFHDLEEAMRAKAQAPDAPPKTPRPLPLALRAAWNKLRKPHRISTRQQP